MSNRSNDWRETPYSFNHRKASENVRHRRDSYTDPEGYSDKETAHTRYSRRDQQFTNEDWRPYENQQQADDARRDRQYRPNDGGYNSHNDPYNSRREEYDPYRGPSRFEPGNNWNEPQNYGNPYQREGSYRPYESAYDSPARNIARERYQPDAYGQNSPSSYGHPHDNSYRNERYNMNWQQSRNEQNFRGYGPKNYTRSDSRITEDINDRLYDDPYLDASDIEVNVKSGEVTIEGSVNSRQSKRFLEDIADSVSGVKHVENRVRINSQSRNGNNITSETTSDITSKTKKSSTNR